MNTLSTHVLDTSLGRPASGVRITLARVSGTNDGLGNAPSAVIGGGTTDDNGRVTDVLKSNETLTAGEYALRFEVGDYFARTGRESFFPEVVVRFVIRGEHEHYHIPLLLSPFGYSTYRGS